jgi:hypothetical protein
VAFSISFDPNEGVKGEANIIGTSHAYFDEPIVSFSASFSDKYSTAGTIKKGAVVVVALESVKELKFLGYIYDDMGSLRFSKLVDSKVLEAEQSQIINHQSSVLDCEPTLTPIDGVSLLTMKCMIATADLVSSVFTAQINSFEN